MTFIVDGTNGLTYPNSTVQASAGQVLQVVNATYSTQVNSTTATYADTGLTATITPKFSTSKILVSVNMNSCGSTGTSGAYVQFNIVKNSTSLTTFSTAGNGFSAGGNFVIGSCSVDYLDSPATTSSTVYKVQLSNIASTGLVFVNSYSSTSTITLLEIAG